MAIANFGVLHMILLSCAVNVALRQGKWIERTEAAKPT